MEFIQWTKGKEKLCLPISYLCDPISYVKEKDAAGQSTSKLKFKWRHPLITPGIANFRTSSSPGPRLICSGTPFKKHP